MGKNSRPVADGLHDVIGLEVCISIDVERDYRTDGRFTTRGIKEGLPIFVDMLRSAGIPFDLMISSEVLDAVPDEILRARRDFVAIGCHGRVHDPGYLSQLSPAKQRHDLEAATDAIGERTGRRPIHFRAPNFSADGVTIEVLEALGYHKDSSVLPGRLVRRWGWRILVDHRGAPLDPYRPDYLSIARPGGSAILEIPITPNSDARAAPLGLGFLHTRGPEATLAAARIVKRQYFVFLAHTWEMVGWEPHEGVLPWVREAARRDPGGLEELVSRLTDSRFVNLDHVVQPVMSSSGGAPSLGRDGQYSAPQFRGVGR